MVFVALAGCQGIGVPPSEDSIDPPDARTYEYSNLSADSKAAFDRLRSNEEITSPTPIFGEEISSHHHSEFYVSYQGEYYRIEHQRKQTEQSVCIIGMETQSNDTVGDGDKVGKYVNLSQGEQELVDSFLTGESSESCYSQDSYPLQPYTHVKKNGTYYKITEQHGSTYEYWYSIEKLQPQ